MANPTMWHDMFHLALPVLEKILRPAIVYLFLVASLRLAGKRELAALNPFDLVVLLTLSNTVQNAIIGDEYSVVGGLIGATTLLVLNYLVARLVFGHPRLERLVEGHGTVLIENGAIRHDRLKAELITGVELSTAARKQGFELDEVERATLDPGGTIAFTARRPTPETIRHQQVLARLDELTLAVRGLERAPG